MVDRISNTRLTLVHPALAAKVNAAAAAMDATLGGSFRVAQGWRSYADSDKDYALGRTVMTKADGSKQGIVTNARGGYSWHNFGMAVDCYPFVEGDAGALDWNEGDAWFRSMVAAMQAEGLVWGGDWHSIKDYPHFQLPGVPDSPTLADRTAFASGGIEAVWARYPQ